MPQINFFTPVAYPPFPLAGAIHFIFEKIDNYFYLGGKKAHVIGKSKSGQEKIILLESKSSLLATVTKIISYCTLIIPLVMLIAKTILHINRSFKLIDLNQKIKKGLKSKTLQELGKQAHHFASQNVFKWGFDAKIPEERAVLIEIVKTAMAQDLYTTSFKIAEFGFDAKTPDGRAALLEIGKFAAALDGYSTSWTIAKYGFDAKKPEGRAALLEIGKIAAAQCGSRIDVTIPEFGFEAQTPEGRLALLEIGKIAATERNGRISESIAKYGFDAKTPEGRTAHLEIGKIAAAHNACNTSKYIANYGFDTKTSEGKAAFIEIAKIALKNDAFVPIIAVNMNKVIQSPIFNLFKNCDNFNEFTVEVKESCKDLPLVSHLLAEVMKFKNEHAKVQALQVIAYINFLLATSDNNELMDNIPKWEATFIELINTRDPKLRLHLVTSVISLIEKNPKREVQRLLWATLQALYEEKGILPQGKTILDSIDRKALKDANLQKTLLWTFVELSQNRDVPGNAAQRVLEEAVKKGSRSEIINMLRKIRAILNLKGEKQLEKQQNLDGALKELIQNQYPGFTDGILNLADDLSRTFLASRNPYAIFTYAARLATLPENNLAAPLGTFFKSVLNGTFKEVRQATEGNPHLRELKEKHPEILEEWFKGSKLPDYKIGKKEEVITVPTPVILTNALVRDRHFPDVDPLVLEVLNGSKDRKLAMNEIIAKIKAAAKAEQGSLAITRDLLRLLDPELKEEQRISLINQIEKKLPVNAAEFINDLKSLMPKKAVALETVALSDTDDPYEILLCGSEVDGSCQRLDGDPSLNQGLLGYLLNGQTRLLTLKQGDGADIPIIARAIVRLQLNEEGKSVMFMERIYPQTLSREMKDALVDFALIRATALGVDLVSVEEGDSNDIYPGAIKNLGGVVPEYVDSASGITRGSYEVKNANRIRKKN